MSDNPVFERIRKKSTRPMWCSYEGLSSLSAMRFLGRNGTSFDPNGC